MNAAAKIIQQGDFFSGRLSALEWNRGTQAVLGLLVAVIISALAVVYITNENRLSYIELQQLEQQAHAMRLHSGQLLLEQASLSTAERIEAVAQYKLKMQSPTEKQNFILQVA